MGWAQCNFHTSGPLGLSWTVDFCENPHWLRNSACSVAEAVGLNASLANPDKHRWNLGRILEDLPKKLKKSIFPTFFNGSLVNWIHGFKHCVKERNMWGASQFIKCTLEGVPHKVILEPRAACLAAVGHAPEARGQGTIWDTGGWSILGKQRCSVLSVPQMDLPPCPVF